MGDVPADVEPSRDRCPNCSNWLSDQRCPRCGIRLVGPAASRLWSVDTALHQLTLERRSLLEALKADVGGGWSPSAAAPAASPAQPVPRWVPPEPPGGWAPPLLPPPPRGAGDSAAPPPLQVQTVLLALGAFSLIVAAVVFLAVTWRGLSAPSKSLTLVGLTALFAVVTTLLHRRSLTSTAEALAAVTIMLGVADAYAVRIGAFAGSDPVLYWAAATTGLAIVAAAFARWSGTTVSRLACVVLMQVPAPLLAANRSDSQSLLFGVLLLQSLVTVVVLRRRPLTDARVTRVVRFSGALAWISGATGAGALALTEPAQRPVAAVLLGVAGLVAAVVAWQWPEEEDLQLGAAAIAAGGLLAAASTLSARWLQGEALAIVTVAVGVAVACLAARVDRRWGLGPASVGAIVAIGASVPSWPVLGVALRAPWRAQSELGTWAVAAGRSVRMVGATDAVRVGPGLALGFVGLLAVGAFGLRPRIGRAASDWALAALAGTAAWTLPLAVGASVWSAPAILLVGSVLVSATVLGQVARGRSNRDLLPWWALTAAAAVQGLAWAVLTPGLTLAALVTIAVTAAVALVVGSRRAEPELAPAAAFVMAVSAAACMPIAVSVRGGSPAVGWTALAVLGAVVFGSCFRLWCRQSSDRVGAAAVVSAVAGAAFAAGAVGAGSLFDQAAVPGMLAGIFGAGSLASLSVVRSSLRRRLVLVPGVATMCGLLLGLAAAGMAAVQAGLAAPQAWVVVMVGSVAITFAGLVAEASSLPADVVWAVDGSAAVGAAVGLCGLALVGSADQLSIGILVATIGFGVEALRATRRVAGWFAAIGALVLLWQRLALAGITTAEAFTLPAAALLAAFAVWRDRRTPDESSWTTWGPALIVALGPSVVLALRDPGVLRTVSAVIASAAVTLLGARWQRRAPVMIGAVALVALGGQQLAPFVRQLPRWITFAVVGTLLLLVGASYERRRVQLADLRTQYRRLH